MRSRIAAASFVVLLALPLVAQTPAGGEHIQVTLVEVPVNVVDKAGNAVPNLTRANFELYDDGHLRPITHFDAINLATPKVVTQNAQAVPPRNPVAIRSFLIVFDLSQSSPGTLAKARDAARAFIKNTAVRADRIAVGTFAAETGFRLLTAFTNDMKLVSAAIDTLGAPKYFQPADPLLLSSIELRAQLDTELTAQSGRNTSPNVEELKETLRFMDRAANDTQRQYIRRTLDGYAQLAQLLDRVPGRKQVILLTEGFDAKMIHGREKLTTQQAREEEQYILLGEAWRVDNDNRYGDPEVADELKGMLTACRRADVVVNAIDIRGVRTNADARDTGEKSNESLFLVTHDTGGMVFKNVNNLDEDFSRLLRAEEVVYILGFEAPSSQPGKYHDLKVKLVNLPVSASAFSRAGYFETSPALTAMERTLSASEIVLNQIPVSDVLVHSVATPFPRVDGRAQVPVIVEIDGQSLMRTAKGNQIQSELFIYAFDEQNNVRDFVHQPIGLDLSKLRSRLQPHGLRVYETLMLPAGRFSVRTLVRAGDKTSYFGYTDTVIDVPNYNQQAVLGGSAIDDTPADWVPVKPPDRQGVPHDYPFFIDGAMLVPSASPVFRPGVATRVGLYVGKLPANANVAATVDGKDAPVKVAARTVGPDGNAKLLLDVVPPQLPPGEYQLTLRVPDAGTALVPFVVR